MYFPENVKIPVTTLFQPEESVNTGSEFQHDNFTYGLEVEFASLFFFFFMFCVEFKRNCHHLSKQFEAIYDASWLTTPFTRKSRYFSSPSALLNGGTVREFTSSGGVMQDRESGVTLIVQEGAVPDDSKYTIQYNSVIQQLCIPEKETLVSPVPEFLTQGTFNKHVQVYLPIFRKQNVTLSEISVYYRNDSTDPWKPIPLGKTDGDIFYEELDDHIIVNTKHFTQFMCTGCKGTVKERDLRLSAILFLYHPEEGKDIQEVQLTVYVVDRDLVPDFMKELKNEKGIMKKIPIDMPPLPDGACYSGKDMLEVEMLTEPDWSVVNTDGKQNPRLKAKMLDNLVRCHGQFGKRLLAKYFVQRSAAASLKKNIYIEIEFKLQTKPAKGKESKIHVASFNERIDLGQFLKNIPVVTNPDQMQNQVGGENVSLDDGISMGGEEGRYVETGSAKDEQMEPVLDKRKGEEFDDVDSTGYQLEENNQANPSEDGPPGPPKKQRMSGDTIFETAQEGHTVGQEPNEASNTTADDIQKLETTNPLQDSPTLSDSIQEVEMVGDRREPAETSFHETGLKGFTNKPVTNEESNTRVDETQPGVSTECNREPPAIGPNTKEMSSKSADVLVEKRKAYTSEQTVKKSNEGYIDKPSEHVFLSPPITFDHVQQPVIPGTAENFGNMVGDRRDPAETSLHETGHEGLADQPVTHEESDTRVDETKLEVSTECNREALAIPADAKDISNKPADELIEEPKAETSDQMVKNTNERNIDNASDQVFSSPPITFDHVQQPVIAGTTEDFVKTVEDGSEPAIIRIHETYHERSTDGQATNEESETTEGESQPEVSTVSISEPLAMTASSKEEASTASPQPHFQAFELRGEESKENTVETYTNRAVKLQPEAVQKHAVLHTDSDVAAADNGRPRGYSLHDDDQPYDTILEQTVMTTNNTGEMRNKHSPKHTSLESSEFSYPTDMARSVSAPLEVDHISENSSLPKEDQEPMEKEESLLVSESPSNQNDDIFTVKGSNGTKKGQGNPTDVSTVPQGSETNNDKIGHRRSDLGDGNHGNVRAENANAVLITNNKYEDLQPGEQDYPKSQGIYSWRQADSKKEQKKDGGYPVGDSDASHRFEYRDDEICHGGPDVGYGNDGRVISAQTSLITSDNTFSDQLNGNQDGHETCSWRQNGSEPVPDARLVTTSHGMTSTGLIMTHRANNGRRASPQTNDKGVDSIDSLTAADPYLRAGDMLRDDSYSYKDPYHAGATLGNRHDVPTIGDDQQKQLIGSSSKPWNGKRLVTMRAGMTHLSPSIKGTGYRGYTM